MAPWETTSFIFLSPFGHFALLFVWKVEAKKPRNLAWRPRWSSYPACPSQTAHMKNNFGSTGRISLPLREGDLAKVKEDF